MSYKSSQQYYRDIASSFSGAAILSATIAYHISQSNLELITSYSKWFLERDTIRLIRFSGIAIIGFIFLLAGKRGHSLSDCIVSFSDSIASFYASSSGSILGWIFGIGIGAIKADFDHYLLPILGICIIAIFTLAVPIIGIQLVRKVVSDFNSRLFKDEKRAYVAHAFGIIIIFIAFTDFYKILF